ncbi:MAG: Gfo/Idh/MocA family oxidoreductase, partial [Verrucomicrobiae bacterium]|nr:Gfo/Idh/MocA family oxidoreductase [Verrucomicrobiae bacterium]
MTSFDRRHFLSSTAAIAAWAGTAPLIRAQSKSGKKYKLAVIGGGGWWAMNILRVALEDGRCECVALCDVDADNLEVSADEVESMTGSLPKTYNDYRELLEKEKPEIVIVSTPDHWHALQTIDCLKAGAHVFVEKPTGHTILESRAMVNAAQAADRVVQVGLHRRVGPHHVSGMEFLRSGKVGEIGMV